MGSEFTPNLRSTETENTDWMNSFSSFCLNVSQPKSIVDSATFNFQTNTTTHTTDEHTKRDCTKAVQSL